MEDHVEVKMSDSSPQCQISLSLYPSSRASPGLETFFQLPLSSASPSAQLNFTNNIVSENSLNLTNAEFFIKIYSLGYENKTMYIVIHMCFLFLFSLLFKTLAVN